MDKQDDLTELLRELVRNQDSDVVHLPYTPEFESICQQVNPNASTDDKHRIWETLLRIVETNAASPQEVSSEEAMPSSGRNFTVAPRSHSLPPSPASVNQGMLFPIHDSIPELQPWSLPRERDLTPEEAERRQRFLADIANSPLATREQRVAYILQRFPETRDSDTALCLRYWRKFQPEIMLRWDPLELEILYELDRIETLGRVRRTIQNDLRLFRGLEAVRTAREAMQKELHEYLAAHRSSLPEVRFYLDETGNEGGKAYTGVAGVCVMNWKQFEKHHAVLAQWRSSQGWVEPIHFSEAGEDKLPRAVSLLEQLESRRSGLLFVGYSLSSQGRTHADMFALFIQLVIDSLAYLKRCGCLTEPRRIRVIKEADPGFDKLYLPKMTRQLGEAVAIEFPDELTVLPIEPITKGRNVLLECADLIAGGMQRRALFKGRNPKDRLAEAVINVTGFEDNDEPGMLFKHYPAHP